MKFKMMLNDFSKLDDQISSYKVCQFEKKKKKPFSKVSSMRNEEAAIDSHECLKSSKNTIS